CVHLAAGDLLRVANESGKEAGLVPSAIPQGEREGLVPTQFFAKGKERSHRNAEGAFGRNAITRQPVHVKLGALLLQPCQRSGLGHVSSATRLRPPNCITRSLPPSQDCGMASATSARGYQ